MHDQDQWRNNYSGAWDQDDDWYYAHSTFRHVSVPEAREAIAPLITQLREHDTMIHKLEKEGVRVVDVNKLFEIQTTQVTLEGPYGESKVALADPESMVTALDKFVSAGLHIEVRIINPFDYPIPIPVFFLCRRVEPCHLSGYGVVLEDLYKSPRYPAPDRHFIKLMGWEGHEIFHLRLSQFREQVRDILTKDQTDASEYETERILQHIGNLLISKAWHDDQSPAVTVETGLRLPIHPTMELVNTHFGLPIPQQAIELLYLWLNSDLCKLRASDDETLRTFFNLIYPQPALIGFLEQLKRLDGDALNSLPEKALKLYVRLGSAFGRFLRTEVRWGRVGATVPIGKLIFANFSRLDLVAPSLKDNEVLAEASRVFEDQAREVIDRMLSL